MVRIGLYDTIGGNAMVGEVLCGGGSFSDNGEISAGSYLGGRGDVIESDPNGGKYGVTPAYG